MAYQILVYHPNFAYQPGLVELHLPFEMNFLLYQKEMMTEINLFDLNTSIKNECIFRDHELDHEGHCIEFFLNQ